MLEVDMTVDSPGTWNMYCHVNSHNAKGMNNQYTVTGLAPTIPLSTHDRVYYIAAEEVEWDYAPTNKPAAGGKWIVSGAQRIGSVNTKVYILDPNLVLEGSLLILALFWFSPYLSII